MHDLQWWANPVRRWDFAKKPRHDPPTSGRAHRQEVSPFFCLETRLSLFLYPGFWSTLGSEAGRAASVWADLIWKVHLHGFSKGALQQLPLLHVAPLPKDEPLAPLPVTVPWITCQTPSAIHPRGNNILWLVIFLSNSYLKKEKMTGFRHYQRPSGLPVMLASH